MVEELKTSDEWKLMPPYQRITILDPDGWDRTNYAFSYYTEKISESEFLSRLYRSTINIACRQQ